MGVLEIQTRNTHILNIHSKNLIMNNIKVMIIFLLLAFSSTTATVKPIKGSLVATSVVAKNGGKSSCHAACLTTAFMCEVKCAPMIGQGTPFFTCCGACITSGMACHY